MKVFDETGQLLAECKMPKMLGDSAYYYNEHIIVPLVPSMIPDDIWRKLWHLEYSALEAANKDRGLEMLAVFLFSTDLVFDILVQEDGSKNIALRHELVLSGFEEKHLMNQKNYDVLCGYLKYCKSNATDDKYYPAGLACELPTFSIAMTPEEMTQIELIPCVAKCKEGGGQKCRK